LTRLLMDTSVLIKWFHSTGEADLAEALTREHQLSFHDPAWAAAARSLPIPLISADARLVPAGLAESPTMIAERLRLDVL